MPWVSGKAVVQSHGEAAACSREMVVGSKSSNAATNQPRLVAELRTRSIFILRVRYRGISWRRNQKRMPMSLIAVARELHLQVEFSPPLKTSHRKPSFSF